MVEINTDHDIEFETAAELRIEEIEARRDEINQKLEMLGREKNELCKEIARSGKTEYIDERIDEIEDRKAELNEEFSIITNELFSLEED